jgi:hypothetical protein
MKVYEGAILTCDRNDRICRYLVEDGGKILFVGDELPESYAAAERVTLGELLTAASSCSLTLWRSDCLPRSDEEILMGAGYPFALCFDVPYESNQDTHYPNKNFLAFLLFLAVHSPTTLPLGIYQRL